MRNTQRQSAYPYHHVMNQGVRKTAVFQDDADRQEFINAMRDSCIRNDARIIAHCQMGNHYHAIVHCLDGQVADVMRDWTAPYVRQFNRRHELVGPLFRSRFRSIPIETDEQLLTATRYIHRNPLELGIDIENYPWSSYPTYVGTGSDDSISPELPLALVGGPDRYREFVHAPMPSDGMAVSDGVISWAPRPIPPDPMEDIVDAVDMAATPHHEATARRAAALLLAVDSGRFRSDDIAERLGLRSGGVVRTLAARARVRLATDASFAQLYRLAHHKLKQAA